jgi:hypothetical protein
MRICGLVLVVLLEGCDDDSDSDKELCATGGSCQPGDTCRGFESDFECTGDGYWKCVPSGNVGDPCVRPDAGIDAP